jgi:DNA-binding NarL/FixJ family response regulator
MKTSSATALVCDDHPLILEGLKRVLLDSGLLGHVGMAATAEEALSALRRERWGVVILDINLGGRSGLEVLADIHGEFPQTPVLILSTYPEDQFALRAIRGGARGYVNKNLPTRQMVDAVREVLAGRRYISALVAEQLAAAVANPGGQPLHAALSNREDQVLRLIGDGRTVGEIAAQLALSVKTVSTYRSIVLRKLMLENNAQLMRYANEHGLGQHG